MRHGTCFRRRLSAHHAGAAPHSAVAELGVVRRRSRTLKMEATDSPIHKLYSPGQIALAAFLGSPLAACWFWSRNYRQLNQPRSANQCLVWGIAGTAVLLTVSFFLPEHFPNSAIPIGYTVGLRQAAQQTHGGTVTQHIAAGGHLGSWWAVVGISLGCLLLVIAVIFGVVLLLPDAP